MECLLSRKFPLYVEVCSGNRGIEMLLRRQKVVHVVCKSVCFVFEVKNVFPVKCVSSKTRCCRWKYG